jgi:hypothetical protein
MPDWWGRETHSSSNREKKSEPESRLALLSSMSSLVETWSARTRRVRFGGTPPVGLPDRTELPIDTVRSLPTNDPPTPE